MNWALVILESPFAGQSDTIIRDNIRFARRCVKDCLLRGESAQASHLFFTQEGILDDSVQSERKMGISAGLAWRRVADYSVFYTDRGWSSGMLAALHGLIGVEGALRIRGLDKPPQLPATLNEDAEAFLKRHIQTI